MIRNLTLATLALVGLTFTACTSEASSSPSAAATTATQVFTQIKDLLAGVTTVDAAKAAQEKLAPLVAQASSAMSSMKSIAGTPPATGGTTTPGGMGDVATKLAKSAASMMSPELTGAMTAITTQIQRISGNPELKAAFGTSLDSIGALVKN
jgi:hypothetical protein